jgi:hypothetical protein
MQGPHGGTCNCTASLGVDFKVILTPPRIFHWCFSTQNIQGCVVRMTL